MSKGTERMCFTPSSNSTVAFIKGEVTLLIDEMQDLVESKDPEIARAAAIAQSKFEDAAMWAVKALTKPSAPVNEEDEGPVDDWCEPDSYDVPEGMTRDEAMQVLYHLKDIDLDIAGGVSKDIRTRQKQLLEKALDILLGIDGKDLKQCGEAPAECEFAEYDCPPPTEKWIIPEDFFTRPPLRLRITEL